MNTFHLCFNLFACRCKGTALYRLYNKERHIVFPKHLIQTSGLDQRIVPVSIVHLDLDNFKSINDQYGHDIGDQYLRRFGTMLEEMTAQNGQAYRMGGDEFAVLYSGGPAEKIEDLRECYLQSFRNGEKPEFLGVSIGYEQVQDFESLAEVMKRADEMMYVEKRAKQYARGYAAEDAKEVLTK